MKHTKNRFGICLAASVFIFAIPMLSQAHGLTIANNTTHSLSFSINNVCSKDIGVVHEAEVKTLSEKTLNKVCSNYRSTCEIVGYNDKNCDGKSYGGIRYLSEHSFVVFAGQTTKINITATESNLSYTKAIRS